MKTLLLLENQSTYSKFLKFQCQGGGYKLEIARGPEGIDKIFNDERTFSLILIDDDLIGTDGVDLLRRMREAGRSEPMVLVSELDNMKMLIELSRFGLVAILEKPIAFEDIEKVLRRLEKGGDGDARQSGAVPAGAARKVVLTEKKAAAPEDLVKPFLPFHFFSSGSLFSLRWMSFLVKKAGLERKIIIGDGGEYENVSREYARIRYGRKIAPKFYALESAVEESIMSGDVEDTIFPVFTVHSGGAEAMERLEQLLADKRAEAGDFILYLDAPDGVLPEGMNRAMKNIIFPHATVLPPIGARPADGLFYLRQISRTLISPDQVCMADLWTPEKLWCFWLAHRNTGYRRLLRAMRSFWEDNETDLIAGREIAWPGQDLLEEHPLPTLKWPDFLIAETRRYLFRIMEMFDGDLEKLAPTLGLQAFQVMSILQDNPPPWYEDIQSLPASS